MQSETIKRLLSPFEQLMHSESARGLALIAASLVAFAWANSPRAPGYFALSETSLVMGFGGWRLEKPLLPWVNDGLVTSVFLIGLEIKREVLVGELSVPRDAVLAVAAALELLVGRRASPGAG